jgi:DNA-binding NarL/FixJ family response regulator
LSNKPSKTSFCRILIASGNCILRRGVSSIVSGVLSRATVVEVSCFHSAKERLRCEEFFAAIFDIDMNDLGGPHSLQMLRDRHGRLILGVISHVDTTDQILSYLAAGVNGYILGCSGQSEIECALRAIFCGNIYAPRSLAGHQIQPSDHYLQLPPWPNLRGLTGRQSAVLGLLLNGCSNKEIARELEVSPHTVKIHVGALLRHFAVRRRTDLAVAAPPSFAETI